MSLALGITPVFQTGDGSTTTVNVSLTGLTAGRGLVALILYQDQADNSVVSVAATGESNMTLIGSEEYNSTLQWSARMAYLSAMVSGGSKTVTVTFGTTRISNIIIAELYDTVTGGIDLDGFSGGQGSAANPAIAFSTSAANSAILSSIYPTNQITAYSAGYTQLASNVFFNLEDSAKDVDVGGAGSQTLTYTSAAGQWVGFAAGFKAAAASGPGAGQDSSAVQFTESSANLIRVSITENTA